MTNAYSPTSIQVNDWTYFTLSGVASPGTIMRGGVRGFERETGWDEKRGKGTKGATLTLTSAPPVKGQIVLQLIGPGGFYSWEKPSTDFQNWDNFVASVLSIDPQKQSADGLAIYYPGFAAIGLTTVVVAKYKGPEHQGKGLYHCTIDLIEWTPPPAVSIVSTVSSTAPEQSDADAPPPVDPEEAALQQAIAAASQAN